MTAPQPYAVLNGAQLSIYRDRKLTARGLVPGREEYPDRAVSELERVGMLLDIMLRGGPSDLVFLQVLQGGVR